MFHLAPWFYRNLLIDNHIIFSPEFYEVELISGDNFFEAVCVLQSELKPTWISISDVYSNRDGAGADRFKNIAVYKSISEALERWAFYVFADQADQSIYRFDENPSTTGMAAYPGLSAKKARSNAILEASERWALHEFWRGNLPVKEHFSPIENLNHYEIGTPFKNVYVSLVSFKSESQFVYSFAADNTLIGSFNHALIELSRNFRVMKKIAQLNKSYADFNDISDRRLIFFSTFEGNEFFNNKIKSAPSKILAHPKLICDNEIKGEWSEYTRVWRYLYEGAYPNSESDHTFFMF